MGGGRSNSSSSGEEDGDAEWRAAIDSVSATSAFSKRDTNGFPPSSSSRATNKSEEENHKPPNIKHYQIKALKLLDGILDQTIEVVANTSLRVPEKDPAENDAGVRLFKRAPRGIVFDHTDELRGPRKKPKIIPGEEIDEKSKKFKKQLQSVAVDGNDIIAAANDASQKSLAKLVAREAVAKAAAKREEERIEQLKKIRGERWLPSIAKQLQGNTRRNLNKA